MRNPMSTAPITGFKVETLSERLGQIAVGGATLQVSQPAVVDNDNDSVSLTVTNTTINQVSNFKLEMALPVPLNRGCQIDLYIPKPL